MNEVLSRHFPPASPSPQRPPMKFPGRLQSLWPSARRDKSGRHSPVLCPPGDRRSGTISHRPAALCRRLLTQNAETWNFSEQETLRWVHGSGSGIPFPCRDLCSKNQHRTEIILSGADFAISFYLCLRWICQDHVARPHKNCIFTKCPAKFRGCRFTTRRLLILRPLWQESTKVFLP